MTTTFATPVLSATDRCDRCGAQAYVRVVLPGGSDHWNTHEEKLRPQAVEVVDETHKLTAVAPVE